jgi:hypothetical protein
MSGRSAKTRNGCRGAWCLLALGVAMAGCGQRGGVVRLPVYGSVTSSGEEKPSGTITFLPAEGQSGPAATAALVDGQYRFDQADGPTAGPHRVIVKRTLSKDPSETPGNARPPAIPGKTPAGDGQKTDWTLSVDVPAAGPYQCDLKLNP